MSIEIGKKYKNKKFPWHLFRACFNQGLLSPKIQQQEWTNAIQTLAKTKLSNHIYLYLAQIQSRPMARKIYNSLSFAPDVHTFTSEDGRN